MNNFKNIMPLGQIADQLGVNKSKLNFYKLLGKIKPVLSFPKNKIFLYDLEEVRKVLK